MPWTGLGVRRDIPETVAGQDHEAVALHLPPSMFAISNRMFLMVRCKP
jgi:hypothetical protein